MVRRGTRSPHLELFPIVEIRSNDDHTDMRLIMLLCVIMNLLLGACAFQRSETEVVVPSHDQVVRDEIPAESGRKIPVVRTYNP